MAVANTAITVSVNSGWRSSLHFHVVRDRLIIEAETPAEGYWLHETLREITSNGFDCRYDLKGEGAALQVPLRKQGELSDLDKAALEVHAERRA